MLSGILASFRKTKMVGLIAAEALIDARRCLAGFPYPSGARHGKGAYSKQAKADSANR
jgi:hypothetical protein